MPNQSANDASLTPTTIVDAIVSPPLPHWEQLRDLPEPSGPLPEDDEDNDDDTVSRKGALQPKEVKEAEERELGDRARGLSGGGTCTTHEKQGSACKDNLK